jgi:Protein kinase domain
LELPLYVDKVKYTVSFLPGGRARGVLIELPIDVTDDDEYLKSLDEDAVRAELVSGRTINEDTLFTYIHEATGGDCQEMRVKRAARLINLFQPRIDLCRDSGETFLQQSVYSPIAELFCCINPDLYCADKTVYCAHAVSCKNKQGDVVQHSVSCLPDGAMRLSKSFYALAMMELKAFGEDQTKDKFRCILMSTMSLLSIREYGKLTNKDTAWLNSIAIPFVVGRHNSADLYVTLMKGPEGAQRPNVLLLKSILMTDDDTEGKHITEEKLDFMVMLVVLIARVVCATRGIAERMETELQRSDKRDARRNLDNCVTKTQGKGSSTGAKRTSEGDRKLASGGAQEGADVEPDDYENAARKVASWNGLVQELCSFRTRMPELILCDDESVQRRSEMEYYQQQSPFYFQGVVPEPTKSLVFCKVWREGDRRTNRKNILDEIKFYKQANAAGVPSPKVVDHLTAMDVDCSTTFGGIKTPARYHILVTEYHRNNDVDENDVLIFALSLVRAVAKLHAIGLLHCDIKPSNVLWDALKKEAVLVDFGHAQNAANAIWYEATKKYEAPEISHSLPHSEKSDAYCTGKTLAVIANAVKKPFAVEIMPVIEFLLLEAPEERWSVEKAEEMLSTLWQRKSKNVKLGVAKKRPLCE